MAWIESHQQLGRHPKTKAAARELNISRPQLVGHLQYLWWWALDFAEDGDLSGIAASDIAEEALWEGDPDTFIDALRNTGFLTADLKINDWQEYTGRLVAQRESNRERQRRFRSKEKRDVTPSSQEQNETVTVTSPLRNGATQHNSTEPNPTEPDTTESESAREEQDVGAEAPTAPAPDSPTPKASRSNGRASRLPPDFEISDSMIAWAKRAGASDQVIAWETEKFRDYWAASAKTKLDWPATWRTWIRRALESELPRGSPAPIPIRQTNGPPGRMKHGGYTPDEIAQRARDLEARGL